MPKKSSTRRKTRTKTSVKASAKKTKVNGYLVKEQEEFQKAHPNAQLLISLFLLSFLVLVLIYLRQINLV